MLTVPHIFCEERLEQTLNGDGIDDLMISADSTCGDGTGVDVAYILYERESSLFESEFDVAAGRR